MNQRLEQKTARRERIVEAAAVQFALRGFEATTFGRVAEELGQPRSWIGYHLFPTKESLAAAVVAEQNVRWAELFDRVSEVPEGLPRLLRALDGAAREAETSSLATATIRLLREAPALGLSLPPLPVLWSTFAVEQVESEMRVRPAAPGVDAKAFAGQLLGASFGVFEGNRTAVSAGGTAAALPLLWRVLLPGSGFEVPPAFR